MTKRAIYWAIMCTFMAIITIICGMTIVHSSKVATLTLDQTVTYEAPENIPVTAYANGGSFASGDTYNTYITFDMIVGNNVVPNPTKTGYILNGWEYSVDNVTYSSYTNISDNIPFTDHLYLRAKWSVNTYTLSYNLNSGTHGSSHPDGATYNTSFTVSNPTRSGYDFIGWNITGMDSVTHTYGGSTTTNSSISGTTATTFNNLRSTSGTVTFAATWAQRLTIPSQNGTLTYSGSAQTPSWSNYDSNLMTLSVSSRTDAGTYEATFSLKNSTNYHWNDGSTTNKTVPWSIGQLAGSISYAVTALNKNVGDSAFTNPLTKTGDGTVTYSISCSPSDVASINSDTGLVTLGSVAGTATVTATVSNSDNTTYATKTASYTITLENSSTIYYVTFNNWYATCSEIYSIADEGTQYTSMAGLEPTHWRIEIYYQIGEADQTEPTNPPSGSLTSTTGWNLADNGYATPIESGKKLFLAFMFVNSRAANGCRITIQEGANYTYLNSPHGDSISPAFYSKIITANTSYTISISDTGNHAGGVQ